MENNFDKLIVLADESDVLTEKEKEEFLDKAHELIIADIMMGCEQYFYKSLSSEEIGAGVRQVYAGYLTEYKKVSKALAEKKTEKVSEFLGLICRAEEKAQERDEHYEKVGYSSPFRMDNDINKMKLHLCQAFRNYCVGEDVESVNWEGRGFAAFKLAKSFVKANIVAHALKHYAIIF